MSTRAKMTLAIVTLITVCTVVSVHYTQAAERKTMHYGVVKDAERQRVKRERMLELRTQQMLQQEYERIQPLKKEG